MSGGKVESCKKSEYGKIEITVSAESKLFKDVPDKNIVWMSHTDYVSEAPEGFVITSHSDDCPCASMENAEKKIYAVQFHPEVTHSEYGNVILKTSFTRSAAVKAIG